jgi:hypothetical protein
MESKLTKLAQEKSAAKLQTLSRQSYDWMKQKVAQLRNPAGVARDISREGFRTGGRFITGGLYFFYYDPKTKDDLPYYDIFPLVLVLQKEPDGFLGLNLHYLPVQYRVAFLDKLMGYATLNDQDEIKRMRVTYDILSASKRFKEFKPCIKKYLYGQVQSKILTVQPNEWEVAVFLPLQQFRKAPAPKVWQESLEEIRKN